MSIVFCKYSECEKSNQCKRFINKGDTEILFKNICPNNGYKYFIQIEQELQNVKEQSND